MGTIKVLVTDDSAFARELIVAILATDNDIQVVGEAKNGKEAVEKVRELKPDIVTMDIEMPVMDGIEAIEEIMASCAVPILVVTTRGDAQTAYTAIAKGALDLVVKPELNIEAAHEFLDKIKLLSTIKVITHISGKHSIRDIKPVRKPELRVGNTDKVIAIASSTGGPEALSIILAGLPEKLPCPIVIAQHISDGFVSGMVEWLKRVTKLTVKVAVAGEPLDAGTVYVSPSEKHMEVSSAKRILLKDRLPKDIYRPSCDTLLSSVADVYGQRAVGIILTGMGSDGVLGMKKIRAAKGITIAQDEKSSIVFGMPKVAIDSGCIDRILPLDAICGEIVNILNRN